jgi:Na+/glutamate symporter
MEFWEYPAAFFAMFFTDVFNAYYIQAIQQSRALKATAWAAILYILAVSAFIGITYNNFLIIPAALGAFIGTYVGVRYRPQ